MREKYKHINEKDFQRYLADQMTDAERNAFERELQKNTFDREALEGFQQVSPEELSDDLQELKTKLFSKKRKEHYRFWVAAATLLLLVTSGILWFQLKDNNPVPAVTENEMIPKTEEKAAPSEEKLVESKQAEKETQVQLLSAPEEAKAKEPEIKIEPEQTKKAETKAAKTPPHSQITTLHIVENHSQTQNDIHIDTNNVNGIASMRFQDKYAAPDNSGILGKMENPVKQGRTTIIIDSVHNTIPAISSLKVQKAAVSNVSASYDNEMNFDSSRARTNANSNIKFSQSPPTVDTTKIFGAISSQEKQSENVIRGYGKPEVNKSVSSSLKVETNARVWPEGGMIEYEKYLEEQAVLPNNYKRNREVIKILVNFNKFGKITEFTNKNKADSAVFELAKRIIENGPKWSPEIRNRMPVNSEIELKIVFRKN